MKHNSFSYFFLVVLWIDLLNTFWTMQNKLVINLQKSFFQNFFVLFKKKLLFLRRFYFACLQIYKTYSHETEQRRWENIYFWF